MSIIRYGGTSGGYRTIKQFGRDPFLGYTLEDLAQLVKSAGGVLYLDARKADGVQKGVNSPFTNPLIDLTKLGNNATLVNFAATQTDGYTLEATVNSNGQAVGYDNLVVNPTFVDTSGWNPSFGTLSAISKILIATGNGGSATLSASSQGLIPFDLNDRFYGKGRIRIRGAGCTNLRFRFIGGYKDVNIANPVVDQWYNISEIVTAGATTSAGACTVTATYPDATTQNGKQIEIDGNFGVMLTPLTDNHQITAFETQLGKPLDAPACDRIFPFVSTTGTTLVSARPYIATEGLDSLGTIANSPSVDIVGTGSFAYATGFITPTTLVTGALYFDGNNGSVLADRKICPILVSDGSLTLTLEGTSITLASVGTIKPNTYCDIRVIRDLGVLKCTINGVETYSSANTTNLVTKTNKRLFAITTNVGGTTHGTYLKVLSSHEVLASGSDVSKLNGVLDKIVKDYK